MKKTIDKKKFKELILIRDKKCVNCGTENGLTLSHIIPISLRKDLEYSKQNVCMMCFKCHTQYEGLNKSSFIENSILGTKFKKQIEFYKKYRHQKK